MKNPEKKPIKKGFLIILACITATLCAYSFLALSATDGLAIFKVHSLLGRIYAASYRYTTILSVLLLMGWLCVGVYTWGYRKKKEK